MPSTETDNDNGRVTMAVIGQRLTAIEATLGHISTKIDRLQECTNILETQSKLNSHRLGSHDGDLNRQETMIRDLDNRMDMLTKQSNFLDGINTALAVVAGIIGSLFGGGSR